ncbi:uncharacterized protein LOC120783045 [Xiphias gladius]|uniref:uncharacterized protein LOC120783045 n=1 Tax=Xiphias gladius TaxID=8245 RepID=UPI001A9962D4|nr:uncharacterized protein LOC120783045 [Xiphias gladius]
MLLCLTVTRMHVHLYTAEPAAVHRARPLAALRTCPRRSRPISVALGICRVGPSVGQKLRKGKMPVNCHRALVPLANARKKIKHTVAGRVGRREGGGFVNEFPLSQPEEQVQLCINVKQVAGFGKSTTSISRSTTNRNSLKGLLPVGRAWKISNGRLPGGILTRCPNHLSWRLMAWRNSGSTQSSLQISELLTPSVRVSPATLLRKPIFAVCICDLISLFMMTQH